MHFAHIILNDLAARNVLEHNHREREIELQPPADSQAPPPMRRQRRKILAVVSNHVRVGESAYGLARLPPPLPADIHRIDFTEEPRESPRHPPRATADLQHSHVLGIASLADIRQIVQRSEEHTSELQ